MEEKTEARKRLEKYLDKKRAEKEERLASVSKFELVLGLIAWVIIYVGGTIFGLYILVGVIITS